MLCLYHRSNPSILVSNARLKFKHLFEKKARPTDGKYVTFSILGFCGYRAAGGPRKPLSFEEFADCCSVEGGEPQGGWGLSH
jgi:hypothetical protein